MTAPELFDRALRRRRRDRASRSSGDHGFLRAHMIDELVGRLDGITRDFARALDLGAGDGASAAALRARGMRVVSADPGFGYARAAGGVQCDEDRLPFADGSFDLVFSAGTLDMVNDLPGALALVRRVLRPDGLFLAAFTGGGSFPLLRAAMLAADMAGGAGVSAHVHPQIDVRAAGDLLARAGLALPVADGDRLQVRYADPWRLIGDLRGMAAGNILRDRPAPIGRAGLRAMLETFATQADADGRVTETFELVYLIGWAPAPSQPKPAARGSALRSLADELRRERPEEP